jgi:thiamine-phosphate pyrophosphorylase
MSILRLIDANANRAREALRVLEDYARFILNDAPLTGELKNLRHDLTSALRPKLPGAILHRDTPGDVGTSVKTPAEQSRQDIGHIVTAAGKRLGEALRSLEEYLKMLDPPAAASIEQMRYRFYDLERRIALTFHPDGRFDSVRLYVLITEATCRRPWLEVAEQAIVGGADCLQLREKSMESGELLIRARQLAALCRRQNVLCIINDRPDIALLAGADGVHVGQDDLPAADVRKLIGPQKILGVSTHRIEQARQAVLDGADYIGIGPVFRSPTKPRDISPGLDYVRQVVGEITIPAVAIAGITVENVRQVVEAGVSRVAVTAAVAGCDDPLAAAKALTEALKSG